MLPYKKVLFTNIYIHTCFIYTRYFTGLWTKLHL